MPRYGLSSEAAQAHPKGTINVPGPCLPKPRGSGQSPSPHRHFYPLIHAKYLKKNTSGISFEIPKQLSWEIVVEPPK